MVAMRHRRPRDLRNQKIMHKNAPTLIIGGTGSFGNTFVPMTLEKYNPKQLVIYSSDEGSAHLAWTEA